MLHTKVIGQLVLEKNILNVFTIYGHGRHLGHVAVLVYINFHSHSPFIQNLITNDLRVSEQKKKTKQKKKTTTKNKF